MTPFKVVTVRQLLFSFSEATRTETFSCLDDTYWLWAPLDGICIHLCFQASTFVMTGSLFHSTVLWLCMLSKHVNFLWLGLLQTAENLRNTQQMSINARKRTQSNHTQDKIFHLKHRKNFKTSSFLAGSGNTFSIQVHKPTLLSNRCSANFFGR